MYIGPWQEFKLAKILQIKDKMDKEAEEDNKLDQNQRGRNGKAQSTNARIQGQVNEQHQQIQQQMSIQKSQTTLKSIQNGINNQNKNKTSDQVFKYRMDPLFTQQIPQKQVPLLKSNYSDSSKQVTKYSFQSVNNNNQYNMNNKNRYLQQINDRKNTPPQSNYSYSGVSMNTGNHSTQYSNSNQENYQMQKTGTTTTQQGRPPLSNGTKASYLSTTQSQNQKNQLSEYRAELRNGGKVKANVLPIDIHYDQWNRFENFLKFASKKEVRDRLKEFDPPPLENYIDPDVIDKIRQQNKPPNIKRKTIINGKGDVINAKEENKQRIEKMKQLYGLYKQFQEEEQRVEGQVQEIDNKQVEQQQKQIQQQQQNFIQSPNIGPQKQALVLPEVHNTPLKNMNEVIVKKSILDPVQVKLPIVVKPKSDQPQPPSLYNFYQKIIDKGNPLMAETRKEKAQVIASNKFKSAYVTDQQPLQNQQQQNKQMDEIQENITEENAIRESLITKTLQVPNKCHDQQNDIESSRKSYEESEVDGLIKWAKDLPDDIALQSSQSFFKKQVGM